MRGRLIVGLVAILMGAAGPAPAPGALANDAIDQLTTSSVNASAESESDPRGSAQFRAALELLLDGKAAEAYQSAKALANPVERRAIQWAAIRVYPGEIDHQSITRFMADAPDFAPENLYRAQVEQSLIESDATPDTIIDVLGGQVPETIDGRIALAQAYLAVGEQERSRRLARAIWVENFLSSEQEAQVSQTLAAMLTDADHWDRAVRLMMHDRVRGAERLMEHFTPAQKSLVIARAATSRRQSDGKALLDAVDTSLHDHPLYVFTRVQRARLAGLHEQALDWLDKAEGDVPEVAEWWYERRTITRALLAESRPDLAYRAAAGYSQGPEGRVVEAQFHAGWIALSFLDNPQAAKAHFEAMAALATLPDTITQSHFWLARANIALGDFGAADAAYAVAAKYSTVYYGQLARGELGLADVALRPLPALGDAEPPFAREEIVRAVRLLAANGRDAWAALLLDQWAEDLADGAQMVLAARLAQEIGAHQVAIAIAGKAEKRGFALDPFSFPRDGLPADVRFAADKAAVYAVTRQESLFQLDAISHAGARGLMQLMPGTARDVARKVGLDYSSGRLTRDAAYNVLLGSTYLSDQLERYDGSLLLAAAAYNAGPGNANKWISSFGDPRAANVDPVIWVELIPFQETRKYVQRVLGNYLVYRARLGDEALALAEAMRRIP
ncbi:lytic transglycosylase domain-containing protein [Devosia nitrariae]|uniref:Lytic transglycosylase n=1 Tax=Devosia nitrariae TaxID=2071872 RepID=A0ABQ5W8S5_9HYPH|nr:lytic transglycosylase domain-containing protein [Devosia nitrariae]GLQ56257.1 lytic transglycosylase [Devosia nitrariae]